VTAIPCDQCDGEDGPAVARVVIRDYDGGTFTANVCKECREDHREATVRVLKTGPRKR